MYVGLADLTDPWSVAVFVKHTLFGVMVICAIVQTFTICSMSRLLTSPQVAPPAERPTPGEMPPEMMKLRRRQMAIGVAVLILGILVLLLTAVAEAA